MYILINDPQKHTEQEYAFEKSLIKIGRDKSNDIVLPCSSVSRIHACLRRDGEACFIADQRSSNGIFLKGNKLPALAEFPLAPDTQITVGKYTITLIAKSKKRANNHEDGKTIHAVPADLNNHFEPPSSKMQTVGSDSIKLKQKIHGKLLNEIDLRRLNINEIGERELRSRCNKIVHNIIKRLKITLSSDISLNQFIDDILDEALALGPLEGLLADPSVSEIMVNSKDKIYVERNGRIELSSKVFSSDASVAGIIQRIVGPIGRRIDESSPLVDARLKDGSRVNAVIPPLALNGPCITIRKFATNPISSNDLVGWDALSASMATFIQTAVEQKKNIVVSGGTGSGKTTLLNIFSSFIPQSERVVTIEDAAELQLSQEHIIRLESRPPNIEGKGAITIQDLVKNALRMRPDRVIVGECRGGEALDMLQAMNTGHDGSMTTGHANTPRDMLTRLETMVMMAGKDLPNQAIREQIAAAVNIIVQQTRFACGTRKVTQISEVVGIEDGAIVLQDIFFFKQKGLGDDGKVKGQFVSTGWIPDFFIDLQNRGIAVNTDIFHN